MPQNKVTNFVEQEVSYKYDCLIKKSLKFSKGLNYKATHSS